jgi:hypothetical protein
MLTAPAMRPVLIIFFGTAHIEQEGLLFGQVAFSLSAEPQKPSGRPLRKVSSR